MKEITYTSQGDYLLPDLTLPKQEIYSTGKYGRLRKVYLKEHKKDLYSHLIITNRLSAD